MPGKETIRAIGVTEDILVPHLRKMKRGRTPNTSASQGTVTSVKSGEQIEIICGETITKDQFINIGVDGKAYNPNTTTKPAVAFALQAGEAETVISAVLSGIANVISASIDVGKRIYLSGTTPFYSVTPTISSNNFFQILGGIKDDNELRIEIEPAEMKQ